MVAPALLALALGTLGVIAAPRGGPTLSWSPTPLVGAPFDVTCADPAPPDATSGPRATPGPVAIAIAVAGRPVASSQRGRQATATVTAERPGRVQLSCTVLAGGVERRANATVHVFDIPEPLLTLSAPSAVAGAELTGRCSLPDGAAEDLVVRALAGGRPLGDWARPPLAFALAVPEDEEERLELSCEAELMAGVGRRKSLAVPVLVPPRFSDASCPARQNWTEGLEGTLLCRARGRPEPRVECSGPSGRPLAPALPARPDHAGVYRCQASNAAGAAERNVTLWVQGAAVAVVPLLPPLLGLLLPALALLGLALLGLWLRHRGRVGLYRLWGRHRPRPRPAGHGRR